MRDLSGLTLPQLHAAAVIIAAAVAARIRAEALGLTANCEVIDDGEALSLVLTPEDAQ